MTKMSKIKPFYSIFSNGIPYAKIGSGKKVMLVLQGGLVNEIPKGSAFTMFAKPFYMFLQEYTIYFVTRKSGLAENYSTLDMANDYANLITEEFDGNVAVIVGISFGGYIAQYVAIEHPEMCNYFVIVMASYKCSDKGAKFVLEYSRYMNEGKSGKAFSTISNVFIPNKIIRFFLKPFFYIFGSFMKPTSESFKQDLAVEVKAEANHDTKDQLKEITKPTLVICGDKDYFVPFNHLKEMEQLIPNATVKIYEGEGHNIVNNNRFTRDIAIFIKKQEVVL